MCQACKLGCGRHESRYRPTLTSSSSTGVGAWARQTGQNDDDMFGLWDNGPRPDLGDSKFVKVVISTTYSRAGFLHLNDDVSLRQHNHMPD